MLYPAELRAHNHVLKLRGPLPSRVSGQGFGHNVLPKHHYSPAHVSVALQPIFTDFLDIQRSHVATMRHCLSTNDTVTLARLAHAVKGAAATYQLPDAANLARTLEALASTDHCDDARALIEALQDYFDTVPVVFVAESRLAPPQKKT